MGANRIAKICGLLNFCILPLVLGYVAQLPNTVADPGSISRLAATKRSLATTPNAATTTLSQEEPPNDFRVVYRPKAHASFGRFDFMNTELLNMATMAVAQWDSYVPAHKFESPYAIAMGFVSSRSGPGLSVKHIVWALEKIFDAVVGSDHYLAGNVEILLGPTTLGVGNVYSKVADTASVNASDTRVGETANGSTGDPVQNTPSNDTVPATGLSLPSSWQGNTSPVQIPPLSENPSASPNLNASGDVTLRFYYRPDGATVDDAQVYNASLKLLTKAAEPGNLKGSIWPGLTTYNVNDDFTFTMRPASPAVRDEVTYFDSIFALATIARWMSSSGGPPGRFGELDGALLVGKTLIGRFCIDKGDKTGLDLQDVCKVDDEENGNDANDVATAR